ncbi:hypothetical protein [Bacillus atrophaeus]|uniref:hypothetical protein n=1 Tax=Bacillus atrophaeus TaxID=1452 RepID=UPI00228145E0|nr:hypothetical protein [Bacillus atrophaeus]MCY8518550.1 hypothetical protein [Bacillus atrophaeus]
MRIELPTLNQKLFISGKYEDMAYIGVSNPIKHMDLIAEGYKLAADNLVENCLENPSMLKSKDSQIYPIIFLYRHYLELRLKQIHLVYNKKSDPKKLNHSLIENWEKAKPVIEKVFNKEEKVDEVIQATENYIKEFAEKDDNSYVFRYSFEKMKKNQTKLKSYYTSELRIDLKHLKDRMNELEVIFYGSIAILENHEELSY